MVAMKTTILCFSKGARGCFCTSYLQLPSPKATLRALFQDSFINLQSTEPSLCLRQLLLKRERKKTPEVLRSQAWSRSMGLRALIGKERECFGFGVGFLLEMISCLGLLSI